jgi:hypothetical protein
MTTKVTNAFPPQGTITTELPPTTNPPYQNTEFLSARPDSLISSSSAALSPTEISILRRYVSTVPFFPQQRQYLDPKLGQIVHRRKLTSFIPQPEIPTGSRSHQPGLQAVYQLLLSKLYARFPGRVPPNPSQ